MGFFDFMQEAIAIDLGTANTLIIHRALQMAWMFCAKISASSIIQSKSC